MIFSSIDVLLVVDNEARELPGLYLIYLELKKKSLKVKICSRFFLYQLFRAYQPKLVLLPNAGDPFMEEMSHSSIVTILPSESGNGQRDLILNIHCGTKKYVCYNAFVDYFYSWGPFMKELLAYSNTYTDSQIINTGNPSLDYSGVKIKSRNEKIIIGITTSFRAINNSIGSSQNLFEWIISAEESGSDGSFFLPPNHSESWLFWEAGYLRLIYQIIKFLLTNMNNISISIRPHPFEDPKMYKPFIERYGTNITIDNKGTISEWLDRTDVLLTYFSASAIDAFISQVPVISLANMVDPIAKSVIPKSYLYDYYDYFYTPNNFNELLEGINKVVYDIHYEMNKKSMNEYLKEKFLYPRNIPSFRLISNHISSILTAKSSIKSSLFFRFNNFLKYLIKGILLEILNFVSPNLNPGYKISYRFLLSSKANRIKIIARRKFKNES